MTQFHRPSANEKTAKACPTWALSLSQAAVSMSKPQPVSGLWTALLLDRLPLEAVTRPAPPWSGPGLVEFLRAHGEIRLGIGDAFFDPRLGAVARAFGLVLKRLHPC